MEKKMLFAPGPVLTTERVKNAALMPDICHRGKYFEIMFSELRGKILKLYNCDDTYVSAVISGSGTASNESVYSSLCGSKDKVLLITNGEFGNRLKDIIECYNINYRELKYRWGEYPDLPDIEKILKEDNEITITGMVCHETSTGIINPVKEVGELCRKYNKLFFLDAISAVGGEYLDFSDYNVDVCTGVSNKCLGAHPGVSFVVFKKNLIQKLNSNKPRNIYLNLGRHLKIAGEKNQTPNTPSVIMMNVLLTAINETLEEGVDNRIERYKKRAQQIRDGLSAIGLEIFLKDPKQMANTITTAYLPPEIPMPDFLNAMEEAGYVFYDGKGELRSKNLFQIANMGNISRDDCTEMLKTLRAVLKNKFGYKTA